LGESEAPKALPANLARPIVALAERLGQAPLLPYSGYVLDNWARIDKAVPLSLDNVRMVQNFGGGDAAECERLLTEMNAAWERIYAIFKRMTEHCDPYVYFNRVRSWIHGWANNPALNGGLIYEGVEKFGGKPMAFRGQTGSQSSIVPAMDALFGVRHSDYPLKAFLDELHLYRPVPHRRFIEDLGARSGLPEFVTIGPQSLRDAFNANLEQVARFRTRHLEYAVVYINKQAALQPGNDPDVGTGGTPFMKYLKQHRNENAAPLV
jgi:indoleamine 2,3-dioxygenase